MKYLSYTIGRRGEENRDDSRLSRLTACATRQLRVTAICEVRHRGAGQLMERAILGG